MSTSTSTPAAPVDSFVMVAQGEYVNRARNLYATRGPEGDWSLTTDDTARYVASFDTWAALIDYVERNMPDSITAEDEASAEDDDASGFEYRDDCETCVYDKQDHRMHADAERTGSMMDEWHAQDGDTYATPAPNATAQLLRNIADHDARMIPPMPGAQRRRPTAAWPKPALSSVAGLAALRMAVAL